MEIRTFDYEPHGDNRGQLVALEEQKDYPFAVKRVYYIYDTLSDVVRGHHAHKCLKQVLICVHGSCMIHLDNGHETCEVALDKPTKGLYIENDMWREMYDFSPDAVLLVLASELYDETDYIRDYDEFLKFIKAKESEA